MGIVSILFILTTNILVILFIIIILGITTFLTFPALFSYVSEITHGTVEGKTFGLLFTFQLGGATIFLFLGGLLSDIYGIFMPFLILGVICLIVAFFFIAIVNKIQSSPTSSG
jgi:MFS family permease